MLLRTYLYFQARRATKYLISCSFSKSLTTTSKNPQVETAEKLKTFSNSLKIAQQTNDLPHGRATHASLIKTSFISPLFLQSFLLSMYLKCGDLDSALQVFDEMPQRNVVSWSSLVAGFVQLGYPNKGLFLFSCMYGAGVRPNEFTLVSTLNACFTDGYVRLAYQVYALVVRLGFEWNVFVVNAFLTALIRNGCFMDAKTVFDECAVRDRVSWNTMITGCLRFSPAEIAQLLLRMIREGVKPDGFTFSTVLNGCATIGDSKLGMQVHGQVLKSGHGSETCVGNSILYMYSTSQNLVDGFKAFNEIANKNVISWTTMATGCVTCGAPKKALKLLEAMKLTGIRPNSYSLATALKACANIASLDEGKKAHSLRVKVGSETDVCLDNALLDMYVKCGCMDDAVKVFRRMGDRTIVTWTTMVMGFAHNGQTIEALELFDEMVNEGVKPNHITFVCLLYACSQGGFIEEGWKLFSSMTSEYGISPGEDHYACMVDLLGRSGKIKEAEELISGMPSQPGPLIWHTLLGACHVHGDIKAGKRAAEHAMHLNQSYPSSYVLLSNMFAGLSQWEGAETLRSMMQTRNVAKVPGTSSLTSTDVA